MDGDHLPIFDEPGALLYLHLVVELTVDDRRVALQAHLDGAPLDVHHNISPFDAKLHVKRHDELWKYGNSNQSSFFSSICSSTKAAVGSSEQTLNLAWKIEQTHLPGPSPCSFLHY